MLKTENKYKIGQNAQRQNSHRKSYDWCIWLEEEADVLAAIDSVEYYLHPSFRQRVHVMTNREEKFKLCAIGWGEFMIDIHVQEVSGQVIKMEHWLVLGDDYTHVSKFSGLKAQPDLTGRPKRVFLSYTAFSSKYAEELESQLKGEGVEVHSNRELEAGRQIVEQTRQAIADSDAVIAFVSPIENRVQGLELAMAEELQRQIIPVTVGEYKYPNHKKIRAKGLLKVDDSKQISKLRKKITKLL